MKSGFTKTQLIALYELVGLNTTKTTLKPQLIDTLYDYLAKHPGDLQIDPRLGDFYREQENNNGPIKEEEEEDSSKGSDLEDEAQHSPQLLPTASETSLDHTVEFIANRMANTVEGTTTEVISTVKSAFFNFSVDLTNIQQVLSKVWLLNIGLLVAEHTTIMFTFWPRDILGMFKLDQSSLISSFKYALKHWFFHVAPALGVASLVNFTHQASLHRRKREYPIDPVIFGLAHMLIATIIAHVGDDPSASQLSAVFGLTSAVVGVYAAVLRTQ